MQAERELTRDDAALALRLADRMGQVLRKRDPAIMGGALAEVLAKWLAGHHPSVRAGVEADFLEAMHKLVEVNHNILMAHDNGVWPLKEGYRADPNIMHPGRDHPGPFPQEEP
jgi:hypothetical protein